MATITGQTFQVVEHYAAQMNRRGMGKAAIVKLEAFRKIILKPLDAPGGMVYRFVHGD